MDVESRHAFWGTMRGFAARGTTVLFATHYLEEADGFADRAVLMAQGRIVADGPSTEIKARVGSRTIRATVPGANLAALAGLPGVAGADRHGDAVILACSDADAAVRALLARYPRREGHRDRRRGAGSGVPAADRPRRLGRAGRRAAGGRALIATAYTRYEVLRAFRTRRFFVFSLGFPLVLCFL